MFKTDYSFDELNFSSQLVRDLVSEDPKIQDFIGILFDLEKIQDQIKSKKFSDEQRRSLHQALTKQNHQVAFSALSETNREKILDQATYTITTGHQLNLLTGPLYSLYKVVQVLRITQELNLKYPKNHFVPIFWMATEDHDFEEINHINLFSQKIAWDKTGQENSIAGLIRTTDMDGFLSQIENKFSDETAKSLVKDLTNFYRNSNNLAEATRALMNHLFGEYGLLIIDGNDPILKSSFAPVIKSEIENELVFKNVEKTNDKLLSRGYHDQVYVRDCNLFYIKENGERLRIAKDGADFDIAGKKYSKEDLVALSEKSPEMFSPNALLRPVFQETVLPNLVYIGGGGEIAYWMQLKGVFDNLQLTFPMLRVRDSLILLNEKQKDLMESNDLTLTDLKLGVSQLLKDMVLAEDSEHLDFTEVKNHISRAKSDLIEKALAVNQGFQGMIEAEFTKFENALNKIESKFIKEEKGKFDQIEQKIEKLSSLIYPNGGFQERYESFIPYFIKSQDFVNNLFAEISTEKRPIVRIVINS